MEKFVKARVSPQLFKILLPFIAAAALVVLIRLVFGLASVTNMNDGYPFGLWITYDVLVGSALGTGGYMMAFLIYLFNKGEYHPLIRSAVMTSAFGYTLAGVSVLIDIGRWWNFWQLLIPTNWNANSPMLEIALCIMGYTTVCWIELMPVFMEKLHELKMFPKIVNIYMKNRRLINKAMLFIVALAMLLPTMHQSSLGTLLVIAGHKVHPLWQTMFLPLLFLTSIFFMGYSVVMAESFASSYMLGRPYETGMIKKIAPLIAWIGITWIFFRLAVLIATGKFVLIFTSGWYSLLFFVEIGLAAAGVYFLKWKKDRGTAKTLIIGSFLMLLCGSLYRFSAYMIAYYPGKGFTYIPSIGEFLLTMGIIATEFTLYALFVKYLPVLPEVHEAHHD